MIFRGMYDIFIFVVRTLSDVKVAACRTDNDIISVDLKSDIGNLLLQ